MENVKIRKDLNDMVSNIKFEEVGTAKYPRKACMVTLFTGKKIEFNDKDGALYNLFVSFHELGKENFIKSVKLVEEEKKNGLDFGEDNDESSNTFFCVLYELENNKSYRLFASKKYTSDVINNYYELYKKKQKEEQAQAKQQNQNK